MASPRIISQELASFVALVGVDWADQKHDFAIRAVGSDRIERGQMEHTPEAIGDWVLELQRRFGGSIALGVELTRGPLINALAKYDFITIFPIPPKRLASYRDAFSSSGAKDDPTDAELILDYLAKHPERLRRWVPDTPETRELAMLCETRRKLVDLRTKLSNSLNDSLKLYYPQIRNWLSDVRTPLACDLLRRWPTLEAFQQARPNSIRKFFRDHNSRNSERIERIIEEVQTAVPLTTDSAIIGATVMGVRALTSQLKTLAKSIGEIESRINELLSEHPDTAIFKSLPGAGETCAPRLLVAMGSDRSRYESAAEVQTYCGIAPIVVRSGKTTNRVQRRLACPKFMKQSFHEYAGVSIRYCRWAREYYDTMRQRGVKHHAAIRALAYKWIRIIYACWRERVTYDDARYTRALATAGSALASRMRRSLENLPDPANSKASTT